MTRKRYTQVAITKWFLKHGGRCYLCGCKINGKEWDREHVIPLGAGGSDDLENQRPAHRSCHAGKTKKDRPVIAKTNRMRAKNIGIKKKATMPGSKGSKWKRKMDGTVVRRDDYE